MKTSLETVVAWAKRKGFVYPNSEIYGGLANAWDFGPYGALLKKNIADLWVKHFTQEREDMVFMDTAIIAHPTTWQASGHLASFADALIDDKKTGQRFRADKLIEDFINSAFEKQGKIIEKKTNELFKKYDSFMFADNLTDELQMRIEKKNGGILEEMEAELDFLLQTQDREQYLLNTYNLPNLSPESRGNNGMRAFIVKHLPNNPET